jgi:hypothetical protein
MDRAVDQARRQLTVGRCPTNSGGASDLAGLDAGRANVQALRSATDVGVHGLDVWVEPAFGATV